MLYLSLLQTIISKDYMVPEAGLEPAHLAAGDFESPASTIPPLGQRKNHLTIESSRVNDSNGSLMRSIQ